MTLPAPDEDSMRVYVETLGCKVNQFESQAIESILRERGHEIVPGPETCDAAVLNTCAVTAESERKSRQALRRLRAAAPDAPIAVCGCWTQLKADTAAELGALVVTGSRGHREIAEELERAYASRAPAIHRDEALRRRVFEPLPAGRLEGRTRALLKIQDGCSNFCAYCIIPYTRGPSRSLPPEDCAAEAARLAGEGCREIVITGIEIASYGRDLTPRATLADAVEAIAAAAPGIRLRLGSLEPRAVTEDFVSRMERLDALCPHFHLSLQSGCDETLGRMRRRYDTAAFLRAVRLLEAGFPGCALGADLITGFPGETEEEFLKTLAFLRECGFAFLHVFPYSERPGTPAASMEGSVPKAVRKERAGRASAVAEELSKAYRAAQIGRVLSVLPESRTGDCWTGHAENYCEVVFSGNAARNFVVSVQITGERDGKLVGFSTCGGEI